MLGRMPKMSNVAMTEQDFENTLREMFGDAGYVTMVKAAAAGTNQSLAEYVRNAILKQALKESKRFVVQKDAWLELERIKGDTAPNEALTEAFREFYEAQ